MTTTTVHSVLRVAPASPAEAAAHFRASLALYTDVSDVAAALASGGDPGFVLLDSRSAEAWDQGHVPGALHLPTARIAERAAELLDPAVPVVTYCWGPGCDGAARAALALAELGYRVKGDARRIRVLGARGLRVHDPRGRERRAADPLTTVVDADACGC